MRGGDDEILRVRGDDGASIERHLGGDFGSSRGGGGSDGAASRRRGRGRRASHRTSVCGVHRSARRPRQRDVVEKKKNVDAPAAFPSFALPGRPRFDPHRANLRAWLRLLNFATRAPAPLAGRDANVASSSRDWARRARDSRRVWRRSRGNRVNSRRRANFWIASNAAAATSSGPSTSSSNSAATPSTASPRRGASPRMIRSPRTWRRGRAREPPRRSPRRRPRRSRWTGGTARRGWRRRREGMVRHPRRVARADVRAGMARVGVVVRRSARTKRREKRSSAGTHAATTTTRDVDGGDPKRMSETLAAARAGAAEAHFRYLEMASGDAKASRSVVARARCSRRVHRDGVGVLAGRGVGVARGFGLVRVSTRAVGERRVATFGDAPIGRRVGSRVRDGAFARGGARRRARARAPRRRGIRGGGGGSRGGVRRERGGRGVAGRRRASRREGATRVSVARRHRTRRRRASTRLPPRVSRRRRPRLRVGARRRPRG